MNIEYEKHKRYIALIPKLWKETILDDINDFKDEYTLARYLHPKHETQYQLELEYIIRLLQERLKDM